MPTATVTYLRRRKVIRTRRRPDLASAVVADIMAETAAFEKLIGSELVALARQYAGRKDAEAWVARACWEKLVAQKLGN